MSRQGELPKVRRNVLLHPGWFNETLPPMMTSIRASERALAFAHLDADLYESTTIVLDTIGSRCAFRVGTVLAFDELFGPLEVLAHEYRALTEAAARWGFSYKFISYAVTRKSAYGRAAVQLTSLEPKAKHPRSACRGKSLQEPTSSAQSWTQ